MVAHSLGGVSTSSALDGLSITERRHAGKTGGVSKMAMIAAVLAPLTTKQEERVPNTDVMEIQV